MNLAKDSEKIIVTVINWKNIILKILTKKWLVSSSIKFSFNPKYADLDAIDKLVWISILSMATMQGENVEFCPKYVSSLLFVRTKRVLSAIQSCKRAQLIQILSSNDDPQTAPYERTNERTDFRDVKVDDVFNKDPERKKPTKKGKNAAESKPTTEAKTLMRIWNEEKGSLSACEGLGSSRTPHCNARWKEKPDEEYWRGIARKLGESDFCTGNNDRGWTANFDFFIKPETHLKVLEGKYDKKIKKGVLTDKRELEEFTKRAREKKMQQDENIKTVAETIDPLKLVWRDVKNDLLYAPDSIPINAWPLFNELTGGLRMKEFSIICGPTGSGKTAFLANLSANLITQRVSHFVASVETGQKDFAKRMASALLNQDINTGETFSEKEVEEIDKKLEIFCGPYSTTHLHLSSIDCRMSSQFLLETLTHARESLGCKIAILDNINFFLEVKSHENTLIEMDRVIHELIMFCKRVDMHVIMVMHPKKTEHGRVESEFDIKGSSTAVQEAHNVFLFNRPKKEDTERGNRTKYTRELKAVKLRRRGKYTGRTIIFDGEHPSYEEKEIL